MVFIPEGPFTMGFEIENDSEWGDMDEEPVHEVTLSAYWMDKYEVTSYDFAEFLNSHQASAGRFIEITPSVTVEFVEGKYLSRPELENHPVNRVELMPIADGKANACPRKLSGKKPHGEPTREFSPGETNSLTTAA